MPTALIAVVDPANGAVVDRISLVLGKAEDVAAHPRGEGFVTVLYDYTDDAGRFRPTLYRWDEVDGLREIAEGIVAVAW